MNQHLLQVASPSKGR